MSSQSVVSVCMSSVNDVSSEKASSQSVLIVCVSSASTVSSESARRQPALCRQRMCRRNVSAVSGRRQSVMCHQIMCFHVSSPQDAMRLRRVNSASGATLRPVEPVFCFFACVRQFSLLFTFPFAFIYHFICTLATTFKNLHICFPRVHSLHLCLPAH